MLENKILTWDNFVKRGGSRLSYCVLCQGEGESTDHLMVHYSFTQVIWQEVKKVYYISQAWNGQSIGACFISWKRGASTWKELPCFVC